MGAFLLLREWPKLTIFSFAEQEWHLHGPGWLGWPKGEILCTRISFRCLQLTFLTLRYSLLPSMLTYSVLYPSANIVQQKCFRDEGPLDWHEVGRWSNCNLHKKRVLMRVSQVPCVWRSLSCSSCIQLAAASCTNVSKGAWILRFKIIFFYHPEFNPTMCRTQSGILQQKWS